MRIAYLAVILSLVMPAAAVLSEQRTLPIDMALVPAQLTVRTAMGTEQFTTFSETVIDALDEAGIAVGEKDLLSLPDDLSLEPDRPMISRSPSAIR